jgi:hypothetical protein
MDFGKVLRESWNLTWRYKVLWWFGLLASCAGGFNFGGGGSGNFDSRSSGDFGPETERAFEQFSQQWQQFVDNGGLAIIAVLVCVGVLLGLLFWAIGVFGRVGLIKGALNAQAGAPVGFRSVAKEVWPMMGQALGLNFVLGLLPFALALLLVVVGLAVGIATLGIGLICLVPLLCLLVPIFILYGTYIEMANTALVASRRGIGDALSEAWELLRNNLGSLIGMILILGLGGALVSVILAAPLLAAIAPIVFTVTQQGEQALSAMVPWIIALVVIAVPVYLLAGTILRTYAQNAWTLTYLELKPGAAVTVTAPKAPRAPAKAKTTRTTRSTKAK